MIVSHKHKFIFLKTRKTGGSAIEAALFPHLGSGDICTGSERDGTPSLNCPPSASGHIGWHGVKLHVGATCWQAYRRFAVERNPWEKCVSQFHFFKNIVDDPNWVDDMTFDEWIRKFEKSLRPVFPPLPLDWDRYTVKNRPVCHMFLYDGHGLPKFAAMLSGILKTKISLSAEYKVSGWERPYQRYYSDATREIVARWFAREIEFFNFTF